MTSINDELASSAQNVDSTITVLATPGKRVHCYDSGIVYELGDRIGSGAAAIVFKCRRVIQLGSAESLDSVELAAKVMDLRNLRLRNDYQREREKLRREVAILSSLHHPCIVNLYHVVETENELFLIMEFVKGGELFYKILEKGALTEDQARYVLLQISYALDYMHNKGVIHRDLKPENILISSEAFPGFYRVQVADFGLAKLVRHGVSEAITVVGTPQYWAPEVIDSSTTNQGYGPEADLWSLGCVLYVMLAGAYPFDSRMGPIDELIKTARFHFNYQRFKRVSDGAKDVIRGLLTVDPSKRMTLRQLWEHPWILTYKVPPTVPPLPRLDPIESRDLKRVFQISAGRVLESSSDNVSPPQSMMISSHPASPCYNMNQKIMSEMPPLATLQQKTMAAVTATEASKRKLSMVAKASLNGSAPAIPVAPISPVSSHFKTPPSNNIPVLPNNDSYLNEQNALAIVPIYPPWRPPYMQPFAYMCRPPQQPAEYGAQVYSPIAYPAAWANAYPVDPSMPYPGTIWHPPVEGVGCPPLHLPDRSAGVQSAALYSTLLSATKNSNADTLSGTYKTDEVTRSQSPPSGSRLHHNLHRPVSNAAGYAEDLFNFEELLGLQILIMRKFNCAYVALRQSPKAALLIRKAIHEGEEMHQQSVQIIRRFEATCQSVLSLFPDLALAVRERQPKLAIDLLEDVRDWVEDLKFHVETHQRSIRNFTSQVSNLVDSVRSLKVSSDHNFVTAAALLSTKSPAAIQNMSSPKVDGFPSRISNMNYQSSCLNDKIPAPMLPNLKSHVAHSAPSADSTAYLSPAECPPPRVQSVATSLASRCLCSELSGESDKAPKATAKELLLSPKSGIASSRPLIERAGVEELVREHAILDAGLLADSEFTSEEWTRSTDCGDGRDSTKESRHPRNKGVKVRIDSRKKFEINGDDTEENEVSEEYSEEWYHEVKRTVCSQLESMIDSALGNLAPDGTNFIDSGCIANYMNPMCESSSSGQSSDSATKIAHDLLDLLFLSPEFSTEHTRGQMKGKCLKAKAAASNPMKKRTRSHSNPGEAGMNNCNEIFRKELSRTRYVSTTPVSDGEYEVCRRKASITSPSVPTWLRNVGNWKVRQHFFNHALKTSEILVRALDEVRRVGRILHRSGSFWINLIGTLDRLCKMRSHTERLLQYSSASPLFAQRFFERLNDYKEFWRTLRDQSHNYVAGAEFKMKALQDFVLSLETTADRVDTVNAIRLGQTAAMLTSGTTSDVLSHSK